MVDLVNIEKSEKIELILRCNRTYVLYEEEEKLEHILSMFVSSLTDKDIGVFDYLLDSLSKAKKKGNDFIYTKEDKSVMFEVDKLKNDVSTWKKGIVSLYKGKVELLQGYSLMITLLEMHKEGLTLITEENISFLNSLLSVLNGLELLIEKSSELDKFIFWSKIKTVLKSSGLTVCDNFSISVTNDNFKKLNFLLSDIEVAEVVLKNLECDLAINPLRQNISKFLEETDFFEDKVEEAKWLDGKTRLLSDTRFGSAPYIPQNFVYRKMIEDMLRIYVCMEHKGCSEREIRVYCNYFYTLYNNDKNNIKMFNLFRQISKLAVKYNNWCLKYSEREDIDIEKCISVLEYMSSDNIEYKKLTKIFYLMTDIKMGYTYKDMFNRVEQVVNSGLNSSVSYYNSIYRICSEWGVRNV